MSNLFIKLFHKNKCVKVFILSRDKKLKVSFVIPDTEGNFKLNNRTFKIDENPFFDGKGYPTYLFKYDNTGPINIGVDEVESSKMTPAEYNTAINNRLAKELFNASESVDKPTISLIIGFVTIGILVIGLYLLYTEVLYIQDILHDVYDLTPELEPKP